MTSIGTKIFLCSLFDSIDGLQAVYVDKDFTYYKNNPEFYLHSYVQTDTVNVIQKLFQYYGDSGVRVYPVLGSSTDDILLEGRQRLWQKQSGIVLCV